jgi:hypothetical protein
LPTDTQLRRFHEKSEAPGKREIDQDEDQSAERIRPGALKDYCGQTNADGDNFQAKA